MLGEIFVGKINKPYVFLLAQIKGYERLFMFKKRKKKDRLACLPDVLGIMFVQ